MEQDGAVPVLTQSGSQGLYGDSQHIGGQGRHAVRMERGGKVSLIPQLEGLHGEQGEDVLCPIPGE